MQYSKPHNLIQASPLFHHMQPYEVDAIVAQLRPSRYERGSYILERGIWHGRLHIIASGQVSVLLHDEDTSEQTPYIIARLGVGECFGEMSLITGEPPSATIRAEQDTILWSLAQSDFFALIGTCPTLLQNINTILSQRLVEANRHLAAQHFADVILLSLQHIPSTSYDYTLPYHIADALAKRTHRRVLLLELCAGEAARYQHFATHADQLRPSLLACTADRTLLQPHRAPTHTASAEYFPAITSLTSTDERPQLRDSSPFSLFELATLYDYVLVVVSDATPAYVQEYLLEQHRTTQPFPLRGIMTLTAAESLTEDTTFRQVADSVDAVFITHVSERPTLRLQEQYARQTGLPVRRLLPADDVLLASCWQQQISLTQAAPEAALSKTVDFVARYIAHQTIGIAFGGGGARGFAHLGVLAGLLAHNVPLDYIAACSIGIIAPGMYLMGKSLAESEELFMQVQHHIVQWQLPRTSIFSNRGLKRMLRQLCGDIHFEDLETPFAVVAADLTTRAGVVLDHGPIWQAGLASVALPGIFPPVIMGKHILIDAGLHDPVPIRLVRQMGAHVLLASELGEQDPPALINASEWTGDESQQYGAQITPPGIVDLLSRSYDMAMATIGMHSIREADVVIRPKLHRVSLRQFSEGRKFVVAGREAFEQAIPALREHLPWLE